MGVIKDEEVKKVILKKYEKAKKAIMFNESNIFFEEKNISNNIPGYNIEKMDFGVYKKDSFVSFFADMRGSTDRAEKIGAEDTFLTIHAIMPAMIYVVDAYGGSIVDLPGDGVMALFKDNVKKIYWEDTKDYLNAEELAVRAGEELLRIIRDIVNPILSSDKIDPVAFGVGIDTGDVIVTKVGIDEISDIKAIGTSVNRASKRANGNNMVFISGSVYEKIDCVLKKNFKVVNEDIRKDHKNEINDLDGYVQL